MEQMLALALLLLWITGSLRSLDRLLRAIAATGILFGTLQAAAFFAQGRTAAGVLAFTAPFAAGYLLTLLAAAARDRFSRRASEA